MKIVEFLKSNIFSQESRFFFLFHQMPILPEKILTVRCIWDQIMKPFFFLECKKKNCIIFSFFIIARPLKDSHCKKIMIELENWAALIIAG